MSAKLAKKFALLDKFLISDKVSEDCMLFSELDGYLAAVVICPDLILPNEWMPVIWGSEEPVFDTMSEAENVTGAIMALYNDIITNLDKDKYTPYFDVDTRTNDTIWESWVDGFFKGLTLRPYAWNIQEKNTVHTHFAAILRLHELATIPSNELTNNKVDEKLLEFAPRLLTDSVIQLHKERKKTANFPFAHNMAANQNTKHVGRNDPCPCGSGKKYKKCCLQ